MKKILTMMILMLGVAGAVHAEELNPDKPFAEKHVLLQISDNDPGKFHLTLDIANNLVRHYGSTDAIDIQVVTFAGGVQMMRADSPHAERIGSLMASDVRFYVCLNTVGTIESRTGKTFPLLEGVEGVQTGVAYMLEQVEAGYTHIHP